MAIGQSFDTFEEQRRDLFFRSPFMLRQSRDAKALPSSPQSGRRPLMPCEKAHRPHPTSRWLFLAGFAVLGACATTLEATDRHALYGEILREEARLDEAGYRHRQGDPEAASAVCDAAGRLCEYAQRLDEEDARLRCAAAERQCAPLREAEPQR